MLWEEGRIVKNFRSETEVKVKSSYQAFLWRLESRKKSEEGGETEQDRRLWLLLEEWRNSGVC